MSESNYVYLLRCGDGTLYCGWTTDLVARVKAHNQGKGAKYTRSRLPVELVWFEEVNTLHTLSQSLWAIVLFLVLCHVVVRKKSIHILHHLSINLIKWKRV